MAPTSIEFVDRPDLVWTFADSITSVILENKTVCRIEFWAVRWSGLPPEPAPASAKQYPVCRVAVPLQVMINLHRRIGNILGQLSPHDLPDRLEPSARPIAIN